jgi:hypothetical protein
VIQTGLSGHGIARSRFDDYLSRREATSGLGFSGILVSHASFAGDCNSLILEQIKEMPQGGRYSVSHFAKIRLQSSAHFESGKFFILPSQASPSFCSARHIWFLSERSRRCVHAGSCTSIIPHWSG